MNTPAGQWFVITEGDHKGQPHLVGWSLSAIKGEGFRSDNGWLSYGHCPRCHAMVCTDEKRLQDNQWAHEQWHAATDFPIPLTVQLAAAELRFEMRQEQVKEGK